MTKYREILRLHSLGINQTGIAGSCGCSRATVRKVLKRAKEPAIAWPLKVETTDAELEKQLFPVKSAKEPSRKYPDYEHIDREMMRTKSGTVVPKQHIIRAIQDLVGGVLIRSLRVWNMVTNRKLSKS
jgi:transposase